MAVEKIRPNAYIYEDHGEDGREFHREVRYNCPECGRIIGGYKAEIACDQCGTFYDWGEYPARIVVKTDIVW